MYKAEPECIKAARQALIAPNLLACHLRTLKREMPDFWSLMDMVTQIMDHGSVTLLEHRPAFTVLLG